MAEAAATRPWWKAAVVAVIAIELLGGLSGWLSNSGYGNGWFDSLHKPSFMPPGAAFGIVWPILYAMLGIALALVLAEPPSPRRKTALILFFVQLALNFAWSPIFFAGHDIQLAKIVIFVMAAVAAAAAGQFLRIRRAAGLLMVPYLAWLVFAATLNATIEQLNPGAGTSLLGL
jgi:tryptophan-rich sensory protein